MNKEPRFSEASSKRIRADLLRSEMNGHATAQNVRQVSNDYRRMVEPGAAWSVDGKAVTASPTTPWRPPRLSSRSLRVASVS